MNIRQFFASMSQRARIAFGAGLLLIACLVGIGLWWIAHPPYGVLYGNLREADAAEITTTLGQMQVPYRLADQGKVILVPSDQVYETRMQLVSRGVPKGGSVGFELFKDSDYGVTEFAQHVNYQRALQGELERTIAALGEVDSARVHLTIRRADLFQTDTDPSKASVTLTLRQGKSLDAKEVAGVQRLVASAVDGLAPASVVVLDDQGRVLSTSSAGGQGNALDSDSLSARTQMEGQLRTRVDELLHRVLQTDNFTVSVSVSLNYDHVKQVRQRLIPQGKDGNGLLVREKIDSSGHAADDSGANQTAGSATSSDRELEFAHGSEQEEVDQAPGRIERISVGIVVPGALPREEIDKLSGVVSASLGLDPSRGDKVDIVALVPSEAAKATANPVVRAAPIDAPPPLDAGAPSAAETTAAKPAAQWRNHVWLYPALTLLVLLALVALLMTRRTAAPRRLTAPEREEALLRLRQWIESAEVER